MYFSFSQKIIMFVWLIHNQTLNSVIFRKGNVHAAAPNIPLSWLIFPLSANLQHLCLENNRFFRCLPTSDTYVRKTYQILGVNPPLIHSFFLITFYSILAKNAIMYSVYICCIQYSSIVYANLWYKSIKKLFILFKNITIFQTYYWTCSLKLLQIYLLLLLPL